MLKKRSDSAELPMSPKLQCTDYNKPRSRKQYLYSNTGSATHLKLAPMHSCIIRRQNRLRKHFVQTVQLLSREDSVQSLLTGQSTADCPLLTSPRAEHQMVTMTSPACPTPARRRCSARAARSASCAPPAGHFPPQPHSPAVSLCHRQSTTNMAETEALEYITEHERILQEIESTETACVGPTLRYEEKGV
ncbi:EXC6B protein, partial [Polypterus senegalus]|nr:EXC6B protein [Polypterus senegalus]